jgi:hypothetical protein
MGYRYEIDEKNAVRVYAEGETLPFLYQPDYPNGDAWTAEQAEVWAETFLTSITDETAPLAGPSAEELTTPRPVVEPAVEPAEEAPTEE